MNKLFVPVALPALCLLGANGAAAQTYADFCPDGDEASEAAVVGWVTDPDAQTIVPGSTVAASWIQDDARQRIEVQADMEGFFRLCGLPQNIQLSLRASIADRRGEAVDYSTAMVLAQQDLEISLTAEPESPTSEIGSLSRGVDGGSGRAFSSELIREADLLHLPEMSVYELLRNHQLLRFDRVTGGEVVLLASATSSTNAGRLLPAQFRINERATPDGVSAIRGMSIDEIRRIEILSRGEASARYGGDGWVGAIVITTRDR